MGDDSEVHLVRARFLSSPVYGGGVGEADGGGLQPLLRSQRLQALNRRAPFVTLRATLPPQAGEEESSAASGAEWCIAHRLMHPTCYSSIFIELVLHLGFIIRDEHERFTPSAMPFRILAE